MALVGSKHIKDGNLHLFCCQVVVTEHFAMYGSINHVPPNGDIATKYTFEIVAI